MHNPPHPGEFIRSIYLTGLGASVRKVADRLGGSPSTFTRLLNDQSCVSPAMAFRLSKALGHVQESWLAMQDAYDLYQGSQERSWGRSIT
ncbi:MAG: HigA family addiction module antitoxin [Pseudomonadota bacterium]